MKRKLPDVKIMMNEDPNHMIGEMNAARSYLGDDFRLTDSDAKAYADQYLGTQLTDFAFNVNFLLSVYPSKVRDSYAYKSKEQTYNLKPEIIEKNEYYDMFIRDGFDIFEAWNRHFHNNGVRTWISFRMNDVHGIAEDNTFMLSKFWMDHPEYRRVRHRPRAGYFDGTLDYGKKEVRDDMMAYMREALERYDVDGIELDFLREPFCFQIGHEYEGLNIMNDYIRSIRAMLDEFEQKRGHTLYMCVRTYCMPLTSYYLGFDFITWAKEELVDLIVATPRWVSVDNDMPIELWKKMLEPYNVRLGAGIDLILRAHPQGEFYYLNTHETALGSCAQNLSAGADFTYLFNYMRPIFIDYDHQISKERCLHEEIYMKDFYLQLYKNGGELQTAINAPRRHVVTFHDLSEEWQPSANALPLTAQKGYFKQVRARCGIVPEGSQVYLILGARGKDSEDVKPEDFKVFINSTPLTYGGKCDVTPYTRWQGYYFKIEDTSVLDIANVVEISSDGADFDVEYAELRVNASLEKSQWEKDNFAWRNL